MPVSRASSQPTVVITSGDPCGIGPEIIVKALAHPGPATVRLMVIGDLEVFRDTAKRLGCRLPSWAVASPRGLGSLSPSRITFVDLAHRWRYRPGRSSARAGAAAAAYLDVAMTLWRQGVVDALVTGPVTKWAIERARGRFIGQTEYMAQALGASFPVMMFVSERLRVVLLTRHISLREVPRRVTTTALRRTILVTVDGLQQWYGIRRPRLAVCGLNPHAGEEGICGGEERHMLLPVLRTFTQDGINVDGPFAADGFFAKLLDHAPVASDPRARHSMQEQPAGRYDAVICWYHDQGLIPFKLLARDRGCQLSLGLPIIRTSPDHGSALDIAGKGIANPGSMRYAIREAASLATRAPSTRRGVRFSGRSKTRSRTDAHQGRAA